MEKFNYSLFDKINEINDFLEDELSKKVLKQRILTNLTGELAYIHDLLALEGNIDVQKAYESYLTVDEHYGIYNKFDLLAWLGSKKEKRNIFLFGAGRNADYYISLLDAAKLTIHGIVDNNGKLTMKNNIKVMSVTENVELLKDAYVIITSMIYRKEMYQQLLSLNIPEENIFCPEDNALISYRQDVYFDPTIWQGRKNEIFVDAGSYNLFTSFQFSQYCSDYEKIYAFEPDEDNYRLCIKNQSKYDLRNVEIVNAGLWDKEDVLKFSRQGDLGAGSCIDESGEIAVKVVSLDQVLDGNKCTMIKMDIEGAELSALKGAEQTIKKWKPRLAICVYHKPEDIIDIPLYIKNLVPEYKFKIRHYSTYFYDTVLYAYIDETI